MYFSCVVVVCVCGGVVDVCDSTGGGLVALSTGEFTLFTVTGVGVDALEESFD